MINNALDLALDIIRETEDALEIDTEDRVKVTVTRAPESQCVPGMEIYTIEIVKPIRA